MGQVTITDVTYIVDENLLSLGNAMVAVRHDRRGSAGHPSKNYSPAASPTPNGFRSSATAGG